MLGIEHFRHPSDFKPSLPLFSRYAGSDKLPNDTRRMPREDTASSTSPRSVGELIGRLEKFTQDELAHRKFYPWADRFVLGYPLPSWQRPLVWSDHQKSRFVTSLWLDLDVGSYLVNDEVDYIKGPDEQLVTSRFSDILLDGQQRLSALQDYLLNRFPVPDAKGKPTYWQDLSKVERRFFGNKTFSCSTVKSSDEATLRRIYDLRAFGGTPHEDSQRASSAPL